MKINQIIFMILKTISFQRKYSNFFNKYNKIIKQIINEISIQRK